MKPMAMRLPVTFAGFTSAKVSRFVREQVKELSVLRRVIVDQEGTRVLDVNRSEMRFPGVSYGNPLPSTILGEAGASFDPSILDAPNTVDGVREFPVSAKYPWTDDLIA